MRRIVVKMNQWTSDHVDTCALMMAENDHALFATEVDDSLANGVAVVEGSKKGDVVRVTYRGEVKIHKRDVAPAPTASMD